MADTKYMLSANAVRQIAKLRDTVSQLQQRINRLTTGAPRVGSTMFAKITASDTTSYSAAQVVYDGSEWTSPGSAALWDATGSPQLHEINGIEDISTGLVYPVWYLGGDESGYWGFSSIEPDSARQISFRHYVDATDQLRFHSGYVQYGEDVDDLVTDGTGSAKNDGWYYVDYTVDYSNLNHVTSDEIQYSATEPTLVTDDGSQAIVNWVLGQWLTDKFYTQWEGDIMGIGGVITDETIDYMSGIDTASVNQVVIDIGRKTYRTANGVLMDETVDSAINTEVLSATGDRVGIEVGGVWRHLFPNDTSSWIELGWDGTNRTIDSLPYTDTTEHFDAWGHLWKVVADGTEWTPVDSTENNYRYEHCSDPGTFYDIIFATDQSTFIEADTECYKYVGRTAQSATDPIPTVGATYASCAECEGAEGELWKNCTGDTSVAVLSAGHASVDYAWLCVGGVWVKSYNSGTVFDSATDPTVLEQCGLITAPTDCTDLTGWPASDDFGTALCDSFTVGDDNYKVKWTEVSGSAPTISGGNLNLTTGILNFGTFSLTDGFSAKVDYTTNGPWASGSDGVFFFVLGINFGLQVSGSSSYYYNGGYNSFTFAASGTWEIRRDPSSSTVKFFLDGVQKGTGTSSGAFTYIYFEARNAAASASFTNLIVNDNANSDGTGNEVLIDPTGEACT